jgi:hypothetical protein
VTSPLSTHLSPEFALIVECCRHGFGGRCSTPLRLDTAAVVWPKLLQLTRFHRVSALVFNGLAAMRTRVPVDIFALLRGDAGDNAVAGLRAIAVCKTLKAAFDGAGLPLLFVKGHTLSALVYGDPVIKASMDIDILIDPVDLERVAALLHGQGFTVEAPRASNHIGLSEWHRRSKESVWAKLSPRIQVDLHTALSDTPYLIPSIGVHSTRQYIDVGGETQLPTLCDEELFAYLAVHGASSNWFRLKWIADFAGLIESRSSLEIGRIYRRSLELSAGGAAKQALLLADVLFGTLAINSSLRAELQTDPVAQRLCRRALRFLLSEKGEPTERRFGTIPIHQNHFAVLTGGRAKIDQLSRKIDWIWFRLTR